MQGIAIELLGIGMLMVVGIAGIRELVIQSKETNELLKQLSKKMDRL